jgi:hypothetical protein
MKTSKILLAAGFVIAGATATLADTGFEPTGAVPNGLESRDQQQQIRYLTQPGQSATSEHSFDGFGRPYRDRSGATVEQGRGQTGHEPVGGIH